MERIDALIALLAEAPYIRGVGWDIFDTGVENEDHDRLEINRMDDPSAFIESELRDGLTVLIECEGEPYGLMDDDAAELLVCFLAADGDRDAIKALREIGCTDDEIPKP